MTIVDYLIVVLRVKLCLTQITDSSGRMDIEFVLVNGMQFNLCFEALFSHRQCAFFRAKNCPFSEIIPIDVYDNSITKSKQKCNP